MQNPIRLVSIETFPLEAPVERPVRNSFRTLTSRAALVVRVTDADGAHGWGEVWCNFPPNAARHRADLIERVAAPMIVDRQFESPEAVYKSLEQQLRLPSITSGEPGPFAQITAGIDVAVWDLAARRAGKPLWRLLGGEPTLKVYASGVSPEASEELVTRAVKNGHRAAKLKVGFGLDVDRRALRAAREALGADGALMTDANQRWTVPEALEAIRTYEEYGLEWVEEPMPADEGLPQWQALAKASPIALAAGENLRGRAQFAEYHRKQSGAVPPAGHGQVGRLHRMSAARAPRGRGGNRVLPALARRRHRPALRADSPERRRGKRLGRGRCEHQRAPATVSAAGLRCA